MGLEITSENFEKEVMQSSKPVVIDMYATWCGPCKQMLPIFEELSAEYTDKYKFVKVNIDNERDLAVKYSVSSIPTFVFIKDGKMVGKETGALSKVSLKAKIEENLG